MIGIESLLLVASILLLLSVMASKAFGSLSVPALLVFLLVGMLAGSEGLGGIDFDDPWLAQSLGVVALTFILFSGGLDTHWADVRSVLWRGLALSTLGVLIAALLVGLFATAVLGFPLLEGLLLGAVVSSTDAVAVFSLLRSRKVRLKGELKPLLELESGSNDPMAIFLTAGLIRLYADPAVSVVSLIPMFVWQMVLGVVLGYGMAKGMVHLINHVKLEYEGLYPVLTISLVLLAYGATASLGGNGFLAVYVVGLVMGNASFIHRRSLARFHDGLAWLMQVTMFLALGLLVFPSRLVPIAWMGLLASVFLMVVVRPISVFVTLALAKMSIREKAMVSWVGLRGAVPIVLATFPLLAGIRGAETIFNMVFFIVLSSALLQGASIPLVARRLGVDAPIPVEPRYPLEFEPTGGIQSEMVELEVPKDSAIVGKQIVEIGIPKGALILLIRRNQEFIVPSGGTLVGAGDTMLVLAHKEALAEVRSMVKSTRPYPSKEEKKADEEESKSAGEG